MVSLAIILFILILTIVNIESDISLTRKTEKNHNNVLVPYEVSQKEKNSRRILSSKTKNKEKYYLDALEPGIEFNALTVEYNKLKLIWDELHADANYRLIFENSLVHTEFSIKRDIISLEYNSFKKLADLLKVS